MNKTVEDDIFCGKNKLLIELSSEENKMKVDILLSLAIGYMLGMNKRT